MVSGKKIIGYLIGYIIGSLLLGFLIDATISAIGSAFYSWSNPQQSVAEYGRNLFLSGLPFSILLGFIGMLLLIPVFFCYAKVCK